MKIPKSDHLLFFIIHKLSMGRITDEETTFIYHYLKSRHNINGWTQLGDLYGLDELKLQNTEKIILRRLSLNGLMEIKSWLNGWWAGEDYITKLSSSERTCLKKLVDKGIWLHTQASSHHETRPAPPTWLVKSEQAPSVISKPSANLIPTSIIPPLSEQHTNPLPKVDRQLPRKADHLNSKQEDHTLTQSEPILAKCPSVIIREMKQPEQFLEALLKLHFWLHEAPRIVAHLEQFVAQQWHLMNPVDFQKALDLLYGVGLLKPLKATQHYLPVVSMLTADLNVAQFRRTCAEKFTHRIQGNHVLLGAMDYFDQVSLDRLHGILAQHQAMPDLLVRLTLWESFGIIQQQRKTSWKITQAGRTLAATLPRFAPPEITQPELIELPSEEDWLDVL
ncbi:MAG: hypothetical protein MUF87_02460 [Anaerolineae bacterium]|jgi:hypothetical protein|nr:hypothetical protein [Anaerolineae bacterium]